MTLVLICTVCSAVSTLIINLIVLRQISNLMKMNKISAVEPDLEDITMEDFSSAEELDLDGLEIRPQETETSQFTSSTKDQAQQEIRKIRHQPWAQTLSDAEFCELIDEVIFDVKLS